MRNTLSSKQAVTFICVMVAAVALSTFYLSSQSLSQVFDLPPGPELHSVDYGEDAPIFFYLFTHTEDHINHELSEERYWRVGPMIEALDARFPELGVNWTIQFQGADASTVSQRNNETGLVDYLLELQAADLVEFGYHAHHDPTYLNRPQRDLPLNYTWEEAFDAIHTWVTCVKDPIYGGCIEDSGGGLEAVLDTFGEVQIVTGVGVNDGALIERSAGSRAVLDALPGRNLNFGFPDHGSIINNPEYIASRDELMQILTPTGDTGSSAFWIDNSLAINDGAPLEGITNIQLKEGISEVENFINSPDISNPLIIKGGLASKFIYTRSGTSPTIWAYSHPEEPELPSEWLNPPNLKERYYVQTGQALNRLAEHINSIGSRFVNSDEVFELFTSDDYWNVTPRELENIALWLLDNWNGAPPPFAYDGLDFYSLTDAFFLLAAGIDGRSTSGLVSSQIGPWRLIEIYSEASEISVTDVAALSRHFDANTAIMSPIDVRGEMYAPAQILYAMAYHHASTQSGFSNSLVEIPAMNNAPRTYGLLETLGCRDCLDTAWSLKPARFQEVGE